MLGHRCEADRSPFLQVGEGDCKGPAFTQDHTYECVIADNKRVKHITCLVKYINTSTLCLREWTISVVVRLLKRYSVYKLFQVIVHQTSYEAPRQFPPPLPFRQTSVSTWREDKRLQRQDNIKVL